MSFFMLSMPLSGLMSSPPVSKHTPLPTSVILGWRWIAPGDVDQARRAGGGAADRVNEREVLLEQVVADDRAHICAVAMRERARGLFELRRTHVVRRRVDEIARQADAFDDAGEVVAIDVAGQFQLQLFRVLFAVAGEAVGAEREGERREFRIVRRIGEAIGAGRQQAGQRPGRERVLVGGAGSFEREQDAGKAAVRRRQEEVTARLGFEAGGVREGARPPIEALALLTPGLRGHEGHRDRRGRTGRAEEASDACEIPFINAPLLARRVATVKASAGQARTVGPLTEVNGSTD